MQFLSIPKSGQSWQEPLIYSFATGGTEPQDVKAEIYDVHTGTVLATKMLYGITEAEIDIAPYLRAIYDESINVPLVNSLAVSPASRCISVGIGGIMSPSANFFAMPINVYKSQLLSSLPDEQNIEHGNAILFSVYTPQKTKVVVITHTALTTRRHEYSSSAVSRLTDVVIHTSNYGSIVQSIIVDIYDNDTQLVRSLKFNIIPSAAHSQMLYWRNRQGGIESYSFPRKLRLAMEATVDGFQSAGGYLARLNSSTIRHRLCSAYEPESELERIAGIIHSPYAYKSVGNQLQQVGLETRTIEYGSHGELRQVVVEISESKRGGVL